MANEETAWRPAWVQEGEILVCPWHALEFDLTTGRCIAYPKVKLRQFPVRVEGEHVVVTVCSAARALPGALRPLRPRLLARHESGAGTRT